jgi:hypothetical protein
MCKVKNMQEKYFLEQVCRGDILKLLRSPGKISRNRFRASLCGLADQYDNPIPTRFLAPTDCSKIPAQASSSVKGMEAPVAVGKTNEGLYIR